MHGEGRATILPDLENFSPQPRGGDHRNNFLVVPTIGFRLLYALVILRRDRRQIVSIGVTDQPIAYAERLIGSIRRECLDHFIVLGEAHLRRILKAYISYYDGMRTHLSLKKDAPFHRSVDQNGRVTSIPVLGVLHHRYSRT